MKTPPKKVNLPFNPAAAGLKLRFAEKKRELRVFFWHEVPILAGCHAVGPVCTVGFRGEIPLGVPSPTAC